MSEPGGQSPQDTPSAGEPAAAASGQEGAGPELPDAASGLVPSEAARSESAVAETGPPQLEPDPIQATGVEPATTDGGSDGAEIATAAAGSEAAGGGEHRRRWTALAILTVAMACAIGGFLYVGSLERELPLSGSCEARHIASQSGVGLLRLAGKTAYTYAMHEAQLSRGRLAGAGLFPGRVGSLDRVELLHVDARSDRALVRHDGACGWVDTDLLLFQRGDRVADYADGPRRMVDGQGGASAVLVTAAIVARARPTGRSLDPREPTGAGPLRIAAVYRRDEKRLLLGTSTGDGLIYGWVDAATVVPWRDFRVVRWNTGTRGSSPKSGQAREILDAAGMDDWFAVASLAGSADGETARIVVPPLTSFDGATFGVVPQIVETPVLDVRRRRKLEFAVALDEARIDKLAHVLGALCINLGKSNGLSYVRSAAATLMEAEDGGDTLSGLLTRGFGVPADTWPAFARESWETAADTLRLTSQPTLALWLQQVCRMAKQVDDVRHGRTDGGKSTRLDGHFIVPHSTFVWSAAKK